MVLQTYRVKKTIPVNKIVTLAGLPFSAGEQVDILVMRRMSRVCEDRYPLRGQPLQYNQPFESVAEADWEILR